MSAHIRFTQHPFFVESLRNMSYPRRALSPDVETLVLRETQKGPYVVSPEQLRTQLLQAQSRLRLRRYGKVTTFHIMWNEPQSKHLEAGCLELGDVFSKYGYKSEQVRLDPTLDVSKLAYVLWKITRRINYEHDANDLIIVHYRGRTEYATNNNGMPVMFLRSDSTEGLHGEAKARGCSGVAEFSTEYRMHHGHAKAHVVYLMDSDYSSRTSDYGQVAHELYACNPVLAAVSGRPEYGTALELESDGFTSSLIKHLRHALRMESYFSLSTLICGMHDDGLKPLATRACFEEYSSLNTDRVSPSFTPVNRSGSVSIVQPTQALGTVLVKIRVSTGDAEGVEGMSQIISSLDKWLSTEFHSSSSDRSYPTTFAALKKPQKDPTCAIIEMSRALWHCMPPYRGWLEVIDGVEEAEGAATYFGKDTSRVIMSMRLPHTATWDPESGTDPESDDSDVMSSSLLD